MSRKNIPTELKRKLLIESGHRCSIPTCKYPDVEFHHIIPWEQCKEHVYDNMIVLCPNCHNLADRGKIDRKSLLLYKANLQSILSLDVKNISDKTDWEAKNFTESYEDYPKYNIELWYPYFNLIKYPHLRELNDYIHYRLFEDVFDFREYFLIDYYYLQEIYSIMSNELASSFEITLFNKNILSIRYNYFSYSAGAAHPSHFTKSDNFIIRPRIVDIKIRNFLKSSNSLNIISELVRKDLYQQKGINVIDENDDNFTVDWINRGIAPKEENFNQFNLTTDSIVFTFDEYQIGSYAEGAFKVELKLDNIKEYINPIILEKYRSV